MILKATAFSIMINEAGWRKSENTNITAKLKND